MKAKKLIIISTFIMGFLVGSCGKKAISDDTSRAERVFTNQAGYVCFVVRDETGKAVGGNCLKEE